MHRHASGLLGAVLLCALASAQEPVDLTLYVPEGEALLIEGTLTSRMEMQLEGRGGRVEDSLETRDTYRLLDEYQLLADEGERATRDVLSHQAEADGEVVDPPIQGVRFLFERDEEGSSVVVDGPEVLPVRYLEEQLGAFDSLWFWAEFPDALAPGDELELDLLPIAPLLLSAEADYESASMSGVFESLDDDGHARFVGTLLAVGTSREHDLAGRFHGDIELVTAPDEGRIVSVELECSVAFELPEGAEGSAGGTLKHSITTSLPRAPDKLRRRKPEIRVARRDVDELRVSLELPSYWAVTGSETDEDITTVTLLRATENDELGNAVIALQYHDTPGLDANDFRDVLKQQFRRQDDVSFDSPRSSLGKGLGVEFPADADGGRMRADYYPLRSGWLMVRLSGDKQAYDAAFPEFKKSRKTLRDEG